MGNELFVWMWALVALNGVMAIGRLMQKDETEFYGFLLGIANGVTLLASGAVFLKKMGVQ